MNYLVIAYGNEYYWDENFHPTELSEEKCNKFLNIIGKCDAIIYDDECKVLTKEKGDRRLEEYRSFCYLATEYTEDNMNNYIKSLKRDFEEKLEILNEFLEDEP